MGHYNERYQPIIVKTLREYCPFFFTGKRHFLIWDFFLNRRVKTRRRFCFFYYFPGSYGCGVCVWERERECVCVRSMALCGIVRQAIGPFLQNVPHSWRQLPTANSIPGVFLRPDKLNLTVIRLISPFSCRYCLPRQGRETALPPVYSCPRQKAFHRLSSLPSDLALRNAARVKPVMQGCKF